MLTDFLDWLDPAWLAAAAGVAAAVYGFLNHRANKRQNESVSWSVSEESASGARALRITNRGGAKARRVEVESTEALDLKPMWLTKDVDPGAGLFFAVPPRSLGDKRPRTVTVRWRTRLGLRKTWTTAVP